jgi:UDP-sugar transporter A1/2/3
MLVLSSIYLIMNVLSFVSLSYIGAGEFTVCAQLKILTTAAFSVTILGTTLSATKWRALAQLVVGCILVTSPSFDNSSTTQSDLYSKLSLGYGAVLLEVVLSGFASIYFEKVVKSSTEVITIWERNFQLSFYSIIIYVSILIYEMDSSYRIFKNWDSLTVMVSLLGAAGGLLVAGTLKYADSIMKTLATAGAIIIATIVGYFFLGSKLDHIILLGAVTTIISIFNYTMDATSVSDSNISAKPDYAATNSIMSSPKNNSA